MDDTPQGWRERMLAYLHTQAKDPGTIRSIAVGLAFLLGFVNAEQAAAEIISLIGIGLSLFSAALPAAPKKPAPPAGEG